MVHEARLLPRPRGGSDSIGGCRCKRSKCLKRYCECFEAGIECTMVCSCQGCGNGESNEEQSIITAERIEQSMASMPFRGTVVAIPCRNGPAAVQCTDDHLRAMIDTVAPQLCTNTQPNDSYSHPPSNDTLHCPEETASLHEETTYLDCIRHDEHLLLTHFSQLLHTIMTRE